MAARLRMRSICAVVFRGATVAVMPALRAVASLLIGAGILMFGNGLLGIVLPIRLNLVGLPTEVTGLVMAGFFAGLVAGSIYGKNLILRVGHIRAFAALAAIAAAAALGHAMWFNALSWGALRFVSGFCSAGLLRRSRAGSTSAAATPSAAASCRSTW